MVTFGLGARIYLKFKSEGETALAEINTTINDGTFVAAETSDCRGQVTEHRRVEEQGRYHHEGIAVHA